MTRKLVAFYPIMVVTLPALFLMKRCKSPSVTIASLRDLDFHLTLKGLCTHTLVLLLALATEQMHGFYHTTGPTGVADLSHRPPLDTSEDRVLPPMDKDIQELDSLLGGNIKGLRCRAC